MTPPPRRALGRALAAAALILALTWFAGGQALLGRIDPALAVPSLLPSLLLLAGWQRAEAAAPRRRTLFLTLAILAAAQASLGSILAGSAAWLQLVLTLVAGAAAGILADGLVQWRARAKILPWLAGLVLTVSWFGAGHVLLATLYRPAAASAGAPAVVMLTGLPLRWSGSGDFASMISAGTADDPALARIEAAGPVLLVDSLVDPVPPSGAALLVAHPRALAPRELVAIDLFVRGGGRAVVLADALSGWPSAYPLGDPRNPPVTSLLIPLLDHWGVSLAAAPTGQQETQPVDVDGARLNLFSAGRFERLPLTCRAFAGRRVAHCRIGEGDVWLVGDADLIFAPLWRPPVPAAAHLRQADTMEWLSARLWPGAERALLHPLWIRASAD